MKKTAFILFYLIILFSMFNCPTGLIAQEVKYGTGTWDADSLGNHRVVVQVAEKSEAIQLNIPWRRRDLNPEDKNIIIIDAATGKMVKNICPIDINRESGDLVFEPETGPGEYYIYYMPYIMSGSKNYPTVNYQKPENLANKDWLVKQELTPDLLTKGNWKNLPKARLVEIQSIDQFNSFYPMELIATSAETGSLLAKHPQKPYLLFPEDRKNPIRMSEDLPYKWIKQGISNTFQSVAARGEFYAFQVGVFAVKNNIENIDVSFSGMTGITGGSAIPAANFSSFNTEGINWDGEPFDKIFSVTKGKIGTMWFGVQIPLDLSPGHYEGTVSIKPAGLAGQKIKLNLEISDQTILDAGDSEPWKHSRLRWLNSKIAFDDKIVPPFTPMVVRENSISCLGREVTIGKNGLPKSIVSYFAPEVTHLIEKGRELLSSPIKLVIRSGDGRVLHLNGNGVKIVKQETGIVGWQAKSSAGLFTVECDAVMEFDGFVRFKLIISTTQDTEVADIGVEIPINKAVAKYMMGMGLKGGYRPEKHNWSWDVKKHQEGAWIGDTNAGMQFTLRDQHYSRPLNTNFYQKKPLILPVSWYNEGKGGCDIMEINSNTILVKVYSGGRTIRAGEKLHFYLNLLLTPFKTLDTKGQWNTRFYHSFKPVEEVAKTGANTINVHHANIVNPYINYPFINTKEMIEYVNQAHAKDMKVKIYNTIRELSNHAPEIFALRSLGTEIFSEGPGGGFSWLQEHIGSNYIAAWFVPRWKDAAIINSGMSRWHNYYLEGLNWLTKNMEIDGIYIDDVAFDRTIMKRLRKILDRNRNGALIDLHSANQYNPRDGFINSANLYLEHFPYINRLWFGEYFDYDSDPDFWLIEVSGIPYGLMGEMLQGGGNRWRGMLYGMTARLPWAGDPSPIWKLWDQFGIQDSDMIGYWSSNTPVKTDHNRVLATTYVKEKTVLVSIASWAESEVMCNLIVDWQSINIDSKKAQIIAPEIKDFQNPAAFLPGDQIPVQPGKGWLLIISEQ